MSNLPPEGFGDNLYKYTQYGLVAVLKSYLERKNDSPLFNNIKGSSKQSLSELSDYYLQNINILGDRVGSSLKSVFNSQENGETIASFNFRLGRLFNANTFSEEVFYGSNQLQDNEIIRKIENNSIGLLSELFYRIWGNGPSRCKITNIIVNGPDTIIKVDSLRRLFQGMRVVFSDQYIPFTQNLRTLNSLKITAISIQNGEMLINGIVPNLAVGDFVFAESDIIDDVKNMPIVGVDAIIESDPVKLQIPFRNIDRTINPFLFNGSNFDATNSNLYNALETAIFQMQVNGANPDAIYMDKASYQRLVHAVNDVFNVNSIDAKNMEIQPGIFVEKIKVGSLNIDIYIDDYCPPNKIFILKNDSWKLISSKQMFDSNSMFWGNAEKNKVIPSVKKFSDALDRFGGLGVHIEKDFLEQRVHIITSFRCALSCDSPKDNGVIYNVDKCSPSVKNPINFNLPTTNVLNPNNPFNNITNPNNPLNPNNPNNPNTQLPNNVITSKKAGPGVAGTETDTQSDTVIINTVEPFAPKDNPDDIPT